MSEIELLDVYRRYCRLLESELQRMRTVELPIVIAIEGKPLSKTPELSPEQPKSSARGVEDCGGWTGRTKGSKRWIKR
ncbi:MAG: hypothetical protein AB9907_14800 [Flexilinea sp.]